MSKVAIITDSNSGITQDQAKELGVYVIPMPFMINGEEYFEEITLTQEGFYEKLEDDAEISTSQPSMESLLKCWDELLKEYDELVYLPMSSGLSSSCSTAIMLSQDYDGKVCVVDNKRISVTLRQAVIDAKKMSETMSAQQIKEYLENTQADASIYIMVDTLKYLKKGGRVTPAAAALGTLLRLKPVLQLQGERLDAFAKARTVNQAKSIMIEAIKKDIEERLGGDHTKIHFCVAHTQNEEAAEAFKEEILETFPGHDIYVDCLSLSVSCHIGPGALAIACTKKMDE